MAEIKVVGLVSVLERVVKEAGWTNEQVKKFDLVELAENITEEMIDNVSEEWEGVTIQDEWVYRYDIEEFSDAYELMKEAGYYVDTPYDIVNEDLDYIGIEVGERGFSVETGEYIGS